MSSDPSQERLNAAARARLLKQTPFLLRPIPNLVLLALAPVMWVLILLLSARPSVSILANGWVGLSVLFLAYASAAVVTKWAFAQRRTRWQLAAFWIGSAVLEIVRSGQEQAGIAAGQWTAGAAGALLGITVGRLLRKAWLRSSLR